MAINFGNESKFLSTGTAWYVAMANIIEDKFVVVYRDSSESNHGTARIGTVSGTDISYGVKSKFLDTGTANRMSVDNLSESGFVVAYQDVPNSNHGTAKIGIVSGTTITFGSSSEFSPSSTADHISVISLSSSGFVVVFRDRGDSDHGKARIGTVSGTTITFGAVTKFLDTGSASFNVLSKLSESGFVVSYRDDADSGHGTSKIGTIDGTTITFGARTEFASSGIGSYISTDAIDESTFVITYQDQGDSGHGTARIGTIDGTTITFGVETEFVNSGSVLYTSVSLIDPTQFVVAYQDIAPSFLGAARIGTIDGTDITFVGNPKSFSQGLSRYNPLISLSGSKFVVGYRDSGDSENGISRVGMYIPEISSPLFVNGYDIIQASGDSYIYGHQKMASYWYPGNWEERVL
ncbi:hypothetical protein LCGC14_0426380 [marine sediment metagenome]|uniref:Uncharacterized protein n=1 Tax=marine sediment metagenome TaxID=412755 RepID=A0A0F9SPA4_9ZZZZ